VEQIFKDEVILPRGNLIEVYYERLVTNPEAELRRVFKRLEVDPAAAAFIGKDLNAMNQQKWRTDLTPEQQRLIAPIVNDLLYRLGYLSGGVKHLGGAAVKYHTRMFADWHDIEALEDGKDGDAYINSLHFSKES